MSRPVHPHTHMSFNANWPAVWMAPRNVPAVGLFERRGWQSSSGSAWKMPAALIE